MASPSYLERKFKKLNCITGQQLYGSLDSLKTIDSESENPKSEKDFVFFRKLTRKLKSDRFTVSYEQVLDRDDVNEHTGLLDKRKKTYSTEAADKKTKKKQNKVKFVPVDIGTDGSPSISESKKNKRNKNKKKKSSLLKRTGKLIVRTCRLMSYGTPYMTHMAADYPYGTRDYRYYDFETKQYDYGYSNNYMGINGYSPSVFF